MYEPGYVQQCSGVVTITNATGYLSDHDGLVGVSNYANDANCGWLFVSDLGRVQLSFNRFDLGPGDYIHVYDGKCRNNYYLFMLIVVTGSSDSEALIGVYTGSTLPSKISSTREHLFVRFTSDAQNPGTGFGLSWESMK